MPFQYRTEAFQPERYERDFRLILRGGEIQVKAVSEDCVFYDEAGRPEASIFSMAYLRTDDERPDRPVMFIWNGGPGSASSMLQLECFGPYLIDRDEKENYRYGIHADEDSILDQTDFVYLDQVGTGYSRLAGKDLESKYYSVDGDARCFAFCIARWLKKYHRMSSPVFLCGESYGTVRACRVLAELGRSAFSESRMVLGLPPAGVILIGNATSMGETGLVEQGLELTIAMMPAMAAVNWYHHYRNDGSQEMTGCGSGEKAAGYSSGQEAARRSRSEEAAGCGGSRKTTVCAGSPDAAGDSCGQKMTDCGSGEKAAENGFREESVRCVRSGVQNQREFVEEAWNFAGKVLTAAYFAGRELPEETREKIAGQLAFYTGVSREYFLSHNLRIASAEDFQMQAAADRGRIVDLYDGRITFPKEAGYNPVGSPDNMPLRVMNSLMAEIQGIRTERMYYTGNLASAAAWDYKTETLPFGNKTHFQCLEQAMAANPRMKVLFASGLYDLCTHAGNTRYQLAHSDLPRERTVSREYAGGHGVYSTKEGKAEFLADVRALIDSVAES